LADAHLRVMDALETGPSVRYNVGNGLGHSVKQVIEAVERISGRPVPHSIGPRRAGDPAVLVASNEKLRRDTGWSPRYAGLDEIVRTAWAWRSAHPRGYDDRAAPALQDASPPARAA
jgi:UDP-glucose 4-epimerase